MDEIKEKSGSLLMKTPLLVVYRITITDKTSKTLRDVGEDENWLYSSFSRVMKIAKDCVFDMKNHDVEGHLKVTECLYKEKDFLARQPPVKEIAVWDNTVDTPDSPGRQHYISTKYILKKSPIWYAGFDDKHYSMELSAHGLICSSREGVLHCFEKQKSIDKKIEEANDNKER